jgi:hypothetical protein
VCGLCNTITIDQGHQSPSVRFLTQDIEAPKDNCYDHLDDALRGVVAVTLPRVTGIAERIEAMGDNAYVVYDEQMAKHFEGIEKDVAAFVAEYNSKLPKGVVGMGLPETLVLLISLRAADPTVVLRYLNAGALDWPVRRKALRKLFCELVYFNRVVDPDVEMVPPDRVTLQEVMQALVAEPGADK